MAYASEKTQNIEFISQVLTSLFHHAPEQLLLFLSRDGNKFLRFYWDEAGKKVPEPQHSSFWGMNYDIRKPHPMVTVALIRMPEPKFVHEAYFAALIHRPGRVTPFGLVRDPTKILVLEVVNTPEGQPPLTRLVELTQRMEREDIGPGVPPVLEEFYQSVLDQLEETRGR